MLFIAHPLKDDSQFKLSAWCDNPTDMYFINQRFVFLDELGSDDTLPPAFLENMYRALSLFDPERDRFVVSGDTLQVIAFSSMLAARFPRYKILKYDRREDAFARATICSGIVPASPAVVGYGTKSGVENGQDRRQSSQEGCDQTRDEDHFPQFPD